MTRRLLLAFAFAALPALAGAQEPPIDRFDIVVGGRWFAPVPLGAGSATLTTPGGGTIALFSTDTELSGAPAVEARFGVRLSRHFRLEGIASFGFGRLVTTITGDLEGAADLEVSESIREMIFGGALVAEIGAWRMGGRVVPFVTGGGGYLRQLHEGRPIIEDGQIYHAGGGLNVLLGRGVGWTGRATAVGLRFDARAELRTGGISLDDEADYSWSTGVLLFFRF